jgi:hypothetical protein
MRLAELFASAARMFRYRISNSSLLRIVRPPQTTQQQPILVSTFLVNSSNSAHYSMTDGVARPDRNMPLDVAIQLSHEDPIWANRGKAIQGYAILEQSLCSLLACLSATQQQTAQIIFYKITSSDARNKILEKLIHEKHERKYNLFWNAYFKQLRTIDLRRNEIVHWLSAMNIALNTSDQMIMGVTLVHPASIGQKTVPTQLTSTELLEFAAKCDTFARLCNMFIAATSHQEMGDAAKPWLDIFQQPLVYPLPANHLLLSQTPSKPDSQPRPSGA